MTLQAWDQCELLHRSFEGEIRVNSTDPDASRNVSVGVAGTEPLKEVTVTKNNDDWRTIEGTTNPNADLDAYTAAGEWTDSEPITGISWDQQRGTDADVYTIRVDQASDRRFPGAAWVGPIWVETE